jgi:hypothetical protein
MIVVHTTTLNLNSVYHVTVPVYTVTVLNQTNVMNVLKVSTKLKNMTMLK